MSLELAVEVEACGIERARADLAVVPLFAAERPLQGSAGRADWRLCGKLSALVAEGRLRGEPGEAALISTFGGLRAPLLLVLGAGTRLELDAKRFEGLVYAAVRRGIALKAGSLALPFPETGGERRAVALLTGAGLAVAAADGPVAVRVRLLVGPEEATRAADLLRRARPVRFPSDVALRLPATASPRGSPRPRESGALPPRGSHLVK